MRSTLGTASSSFIRATNVTLLSVMESFFAYLPTSVHPLIVTGRYAKKDAITDSKITFVAMMKLLLAVPKVERIYISVERSYK